MEITTKEVYTLGEKSFESLSELKTHIYSLLEETTGSAVDSWKCLNLTQKQTAKMYNKIIQDPIRYNSVREILNLEIHLHGEDIAIFSNKFNRLAFRPANIKDILTSKLYPYNINFEVNYVTELATVSDTQGNSGLFDLYELFDHVMMYMYNDSVELFEQLKNNNLKN